EYLQKQRWFAGKSRRIKSTQVADWAALETPPSALALLEVQFDSNSSDTYLLPLGMTFGDAGEELQRAAPNAAVASVVSGKTGGLLHDGVLDDKMCAALLSLIENASELRAQHGCIRGVRGKAFRDLLALAETPLSVRRGSAGQSNTSILYSGQFLRKVVRRQEAGVNPDCEIGRYLTEEKKFDHIPPYAGSIEYLPDQGTEPATLAILQGFVENEGDGWKWTLEELDRYYEACALATFPENMSS